MPIFFHEENINYRLKGKNEIKSWIRSVLVMEEKVQGEINIVLTTDENLRKINKEYLKREYYTDIITFNYTEGQAISGDLFISCDRVRENAGKYGQDQRTELLRVIVHGVLHLIGYDDASQGDKRIMRLKENNYLKTFAD